MSATKHLAFQKFEAVDLSFRHAITPIRRASGANSSIIAAYPVGKTREFCHMTGFGSVKPGVQVLGPAVFQQGHKLLAKPGRRRGDPR